MGVDLIFQIAGIAILVSVVNQVLIRTGRDEHAMLTTLVGLIIVLLMVIKEINNFFNTVKTMFRF